MTGSGGFSYSVGAMLNGWGDIQPWPAKIVGPFSFGCGESFAHDVMEAGLEVKVSRSTCPASLLGGAFNVML